jgi:hypothetical protein
MGEDELAPWARENRLSMTSKYKLPQFHTEHGEYFFYREVRLWLGRQHSHSDSSAGNEAPDAVDPPPLEGSEKIWAGLCTDLDSTENYSLDFAMLLLNIAGEHSRLQHLSQALTCWWRALEILQSDRLTPLQATLTDMPPEQQQAIFKRNTEQLLSYTLTKLETFPYKDYKSLAYQRQKKSGRGIKSEKRRRDKIKLK